MTRLARVVTALALAGVTAGCNAISQVSGDERACRKANDRTLAELPAFPRAQEESRVVSPFYGDDERSAEGWTTNVVYRLPEHVAQRSVIDFYVRRTPGWRHRVEYSPGVEVATGEPRPGAWGAMLRRGNTTVGVNTDNLIAASGRRYEVGVSCRRR